MAIQPLEQRLSSILPTAAPVAPADPTKLEPMPAEAVDEPMADDVTSQPGTPSMAEGIQIAGPVDAALRKLITGQATKAERQLVPGKILDTELPEAAKAGRYKIIPEASPALTETVGQATSRRQAQGALVGKPSPTTEELAAGVKVEPFNLSQYQNHDAAGIVAGVADALNIKTKAVTFDEIKAKAAESGIGESFLTRLIGSDGRMMANAVETYKALEVLETSANELDKLFKLVNSGMATDSDKLMLRQQVAFHGLIQKGVKGIQTETARALAVFRIPRDGNAQVIRQVLDEFGGDGALQDMARSYLSLESRAAQNAMIEKSMMSGVKDVWFTTFINGLLSSPVSHAKNIVSNTLFGLYQIPERTVAALYGNVLPTGVRSWRSLVPGSEAEKVGMDEALTMVQSLRNGIVEGMQLASTAWKNNAPSDLMTKIEMQRGNMTPSISSGAFGMEQDTWMAKALDFYGTAVTIPGRALMTEDEFFKGVLYRMELNTLVTRRGKQVYREGIDAGLSDADAAARAEAEVVELMKRPSADIDDAAMQFAKNGTFTADLPPGLEKIQRVFDNWALKIAVPFFKTPANIGLNVVERTPFAPISSRWRQEMAAGGIQRDMAMAKVTLGSTLLTTFALMSAEGNITGGEPKRPEERETWKRNGIQPYSIKIGDKWYSYSGMEPIGALLAISADYAQYARHEPDKGKIEQVFMGGVYGMYEYLKEQPYLQGVAEITKALGLGRTAGELDGEKAFNELTKQFSGFVIGGSPAGAYSSMVAGIERLNNPQAAGVRTDVDLPMGIRGFYEAFNKWRTRLPYGNESLPEQLNLWGDVVTQGQGNPMELVLPTKVSPDKFSAVDDLLLQIGSPIGMPDKKLNGIEMDDVQYNRLLFIYGKELNAQQEILDHMMNPGFDLLSLKDKQQSVQRVHSKLMGAAKLQLKDEFPGLSAKIEELDALRDANGLYYKPD